MRLTGGEGKGRRLLDAPPNVRPTAGRIREQLFFLLRDEIPGARVLDLFAGTGSLGLEAVARGASHVTFVEKDRKAICTIKGNIDRCKCGESVTVVAGDVFTRLRTPFQLGGPFNLVLADPPYADDHLPSLLELLRDQTLLTARGLFVYETRVTQDPVEADGWSLIDDRRMGGTRVLTYEITG